MLFLFVKEGNPVNNFQKTFFVLSWNLLGLFCGPSQNQGKILPQIVGRMYAEVLSVDVRFIRCGFGDVLVYFL